MKLHLDHWPLRTMGVLFGVGCLVVGLLGAFGDDSASALDEAAQFDFAIIAIVTGLIATAGSLLTTDIIGFWYCNPKRLAARRAGEERSLNLSTGP
ncbi:MAG: hypothetical protein ACR2P3_01100 [Geminicoccaceae bacterium]